MIGFGFFANFFSSFNCKFSRAGYIITKRHTPIGIDIPANCRLLIAILSSGMTCERKSPVSMHTKTHRARYFSKTPRCTSVFSPKGHFPKKQEGHLLLFCLAIHVAQVGAWQHWFSGIPYGHVRVLLMFLVTSFWS